MSDAGKIKFSMNGFRRNFSDDVKKLADIINLVIDNDFYEEEEDLIEAVNNIITHSNVLNCVYVEGDDDFINMSDLEVDLLEIRNR